MTGTMKEELGDAYEEYVPDSQFGSVPKRGTAFANHLIKTVIDYAKCMCYSVFVLFLDLSQAYDLCIREILFGWHQDFSEDPIALLTRLGVDPEAAEKVAEEINNTGGLLASLGVSKRTCEMFKSLHTNRWFVYSDLDSIIVSNRG